MQKDSGEAKSRTLVTQRLLSEDTLDNYPSYGWPIQCPFCAIGNTRITLPDCDGASGVCALCGAHLSVERFGRILSVSTHTRAPQLSIQDYNKGVASGVQGDFQGAHELFRKATSYGGAHFDRAVIECRKLAEDAIAGRIDRQTAIHMFRAIDYCDQGDESRREAELVKAIRLAPQYARAHYDLGHHYGILGQTDKAIDKFQEALSHDLSFAPAYFNLGVAYGHLQQPEESARYYHKTIELDDSFPEAHNNLGFHYASVEEFGRAQTHWYRAVELGYIVNVLAIKKAAGVRSGGCLSVLLTGMLVAAGVVLIVLLN